MIEIERLFYAYLDELNIITILLPLTYHKGESNVFYLHNDVTSIELAINEKVCLPDAIKYICTIEPEPLIGLSYTVHDQHGGKTDLQVGAVIRTKAFDEKFYYDGSLGVHYSPERTLFTLWAPTATNCQLCLVKPDGSESIDKAMIRMDKGVWTIEVEGDLNRYQYSYMVCVNLCWREAVDPYAVAVSANGERGVIIDLGQTPIMERAVTDYQSPTDAIIYEAHVRDLTIHPNSGVTHKGLYLGAAEEGTTHPSGLKTGFSYLQDLGVTHIEFLPLNDFAGVDELGTLEDYNWGYNPLHFNAPEGSYSTDPRDPYARVNELKTLINVFHQGGLRVILDVVYNHVFIREDSSFEKIVPGYYFRHDHNGMPSNGTGVGNDLASEHLMVRKFIVDSVLFWKKEYFVDGFRFDLMGILDIDTMNEVRNALDAIDVNTLTIGEGWDLNTPISIEDKASIRNEKKLPRIGQFNDYFRDSVKGSTFNLHDKGYVLGNERYYEAVKQILAGSVGLKERGLFQEPDRSVNYIESHDNHTFWDKLNICEHEESDEIRKKQHRLATSIVLLSQGIPFLHSGQEFYRSKNGIGNSYRSPNEINQLDWNAAAKYVDDIRYIQGLIQLRKSHQAFRLPTSELIRKHVSFLSVPKPVIGMMLNEVESFGEYASIIIFINPLKTSMNVPLPSNDWIVLVDEMNAGSVSLRAVHEQEVVLSPISTLVLASYKKV